MKREQGLSFRLWSGMLHASAVIGRQLSRRRPLPVFLGITSSCLLLLTTSHAQNASFVYRGYLKDQGEPAFGTYDLQFALYDSLEDLGPPLSGPINSEAVPVENGRVTATIDFGAGVFNGDSRWLEISVRTNGGNAFIILSPRQRLTPTPYAITAQNVMPGGILPGTNSNAMLFDNSANRFLGAFKGDGSALVNLPYGALAKSAQQTITNVAFQAAKTITSKLTAALLTNHASAGAFRATSPRLTSDFAGSIILNATNRDAYPHSLHIIQPSYNGPTPIYIEGDYKDGVQGPKYITAIAPGNPAMFSNAYITLDGGDGTEIFEHAYMLGIYSDVSTCIELINPSPLPDSYLIEAAGPQLAGDYPIVWTVSSRGQMSLNNPYGDLYTSPQLLLKDAASTNPPYSFHARSGLLTIGTYDEADETETPVIAIKNGRVGVGTTDPRATLEVHGQLYAPTNTAPFSVKTGTETIITNGQNRSQLLLQLIFKLTHSGKPSCLIVSTNESSTNTYVAAPFPSGLGVNASTTNLYTFPIQPNSTIRITDTSSGTASIALLKYELFGQ